MTTPKTEQPMAGGERAPGVCALCGNSGIEQRHPFIVRCRCGAAAAESETGGSQKESGSPAAPGSADSLLAQKIVELEAEVARLRKVARARLGRQPRPGIGGTIQRLREVRGIGPRQLGEKSGCGSALVTQIETRDHPNVTLHNLEKLAGGLGLRLSELVDAYEKENPPNDGTELLAPEKKL